MLVIMLLEIEVDQFKFGDSNNYWIPIKVVYFVITDLVFLVLLNIIIRAQTQQDNQIQNYSEDSSSSSVNYQSSDVQETFVY